MDTYQAIETFEDDCSEEDEVRALQSLINSGDWGLPGSYGRAMMGAIEAGACALGPLRSRDYFDNMVPSRDDIEPGTKGSVEFVVAHSPFGRVLE